MKITREEVLHVAALARLELDDAAIDRFSDQIGAILEYMETLNRIDTEGIPATSHAIALSNAFREDEERGHLDREDALGNAPQQDAGSFIVPKVVG